MGLFHELEEKGDRHGGSFAAKSRGDGLAWQQNDPLMTPLRRRLGLAEEQLAHDSSPLIRNQPWFPPHQNFTKQLTYISCSIDGSNGSDNGSDGYGDICCFLNSSVGNDDRSDGSGDG